MMGRSASFSLFLLLRKAIDDGIVCKRDPQTPSQQANFPPPVPFEACVRVSERFFLFPFEEIVSKRTI